MKRNICPSSLSGLWLSWANEFVTVDRFAEFYGLSSDVARRVIRWGRSRWNRNLRTLS